MQKPETCSSVMLRNLPPGSFEDLGSNLYSPKSQAANSSNGNSHRYPGLSLNPHKGDVLYYPHVAGGKEDAEVERVSPEAPSLFMPKPQLFTMLLYGLPISPLHPRTFWPPRQEESIRISEKWQGRGQPHVVVATALDSVRRSP